MKHSVVYTKTVVNTHPKTKKRTDIPAGTKAEMTDEELAGARHAVRVLKPKAEKQKPES